MCVVEGFPFFQELLNLMINNLLKSFGQNTFQSNTSIVGREGRVLFPWFSIGIILPALKSTGSSPVASDSLNSMATVSAILPAVSFKSDERGLHQVQELC